MIRRATLLTILALAAGLAVVPSASAKFLQFSSPSGGIGCVMDSGGVRCDVRTHSWKAPPKPKSCDVDYGGGVQVGKSRKASFVCAGDTTLGAKRKLAYGRSISRGRFTCSSHTSGMRCVNRRNHHGFSVSRQKARLF